MSISDHPGDDLEDIFDSAYESIISCGSRVHAFLGRRVALVIDASSQLPLSQWSGERANRRAVSASISAIENLISALDSVVGRVPAPRSYRGRDVRVEVAFLENAAGLAGHGVAGVAVGPAFIRGLVESAAQGALILPHVLCYEIMRNYIFPEEFTVVFDYCLRSSREPGAELSPSCWGWVNQGFVNVVGTLLVEEIYPQVDFTYHGHTRDAFLAQMEAHAKKYVDGGLPWADTFMHERLLWDQNSSLDNVYSGVLIVLWRAHGRVTFLRRFFAAIPRLRATRAPKGKDDVDTARENFFLAACAGAQTNLITYFEGELRWPLREAARSAAAAYPLMSANMAMPLPSESAAHVVAVPLSSTNSATADLERAVSPPTPYDNMRTYREGDVMTFKGIDYVMVVGIGGAGFTPEHPFSIEHGCWTRASMPIPNVPTARAPHQPPEIDLSVLVRELSRGIPERLLALADPHAYDAAFDQTPICGALSHEVAPGLYVGAQGAAGVLFKHEDSDTVRAEVLATLRSRRTTVIVCCSSDDACARIFEVDGISYAAALLSDGDAASISASVPAFCGLVARALTLARAAWARGESVLVHCNSGMHRSASVAMAIMMARSRAVGPAGLAAAFAAAVKARPVVRPSFWPLLEGEAFGEWLLQL